MPELVSSHPSLPVPAGARLLTRLGPGYLLVLPALLFLAACFLYPLWIMGVRSVTDPSPATYLRFFDSPVYLGSLWLTIWLSLVVTLACLLVGYPYALLLARTNGALHWLFMFVVLLPFWSSLLVRTYAWSVLLRDRGIINSALLQLGLIDQPLRLMGNRLGTVIGMVHVLLPFMVLPVYAAMRRLDHDLELAASGLGAAPWRVFRRVTLPLTLPGAVAGAIFVFVLAVGFYITPAILGGRTAFFSLVIVAQVNQLLDFGFASALGMILLVVVLLVVAVGMRLVPLDDLFRRGG